MSAELPEGWKFFQSKQGSDEPPHWYATPPYSGSVFALRERYGASKSDQPAWNLAHTVDASTWDELCTEAAAQELLHRSLAEGDA